MERSVDLRRLFASLLPWAALLACGGEVSAPDPLAAPSLEPRFALCRENVDSVSILPARGAGLHAVAVQLTRPGTGAFDEFTTRHLGRTVAVVFGDRLFARSQVETRVRSGLLVDPRFVSEADARAAREEVLRALPEAPCGPAV